MPRGSAATSSRCRAYARQFLEMMQKPDVDHIEGLSPAISIEQKTTIAQPALDRRHRHRDLRLHAPALGARRRALQPRHRPADRRPDGQPDGRPGDGAARRHPPLSARPGRARPQGRVSQGAGRVAEGRLHPRPHRRRSSTRSRTPRARQEIQARHRGGGRPAGRARGHRDAAGGQPRDGAEAGRGAGLSRSGRSQPLSLQGRGPGASGRSRRGDRPSTPRAPTRSTLSRQGEGRRRCCSDNAPPGRIVFSEKFACPVSGFTIAEIEPRLFSLQRPAGRLPGLRRARREAAVRSRAGRPQRGALASRRARSSPGRKSNPPSPYYMQVLGSLAREFGFSLETPWNDLPEEVHDIILHGTKGTPGHPALRRRPQELRGAASRSRA